MGDKGSGDPGGGFIHFGSLEDDPSALKDDSGLERAQGNGNVSIVAERDINATLELSTAALEEQEKHAQALRSVSAKRYERAIKVATDDTQVKLQLRALGEPICLFGEREGERRSRLRSIISKQTTEGRDVASLLDLAEQEPIAGRKRSLAEVSGATPTEDKVREERSSTFYTKASEGLVKARQEIAKFSWNRAETRLLDERSRRKDPELALAQEEKDLEAQEAATQLGVLGSEIGDTRPVSCCAFSCDNRAANLGDLGITNAIATGSFSGLIKLWDQETFKPISVLEGHEDRVVALRFSGTKHNLLATGSADNTAKLWHARKVLEEAREKESHDGAMQADQESTSAAEDPSTKTIPSATCALSTFSGHALRISSLAWHPMEAHLATTSFDHTWRLWDAGTGSELLLQEGHDAPVYGIAFHPDGSLAATGDLLGIGRLWDLRSGQAISSLQGHAQGLICADFNTDGRTLATGSLDNSVRLWDLRNHCRSLADIPAHMHVVSQVRFDPLDGAFLVTSSYDRSVRIWSTRTQKLLADLKGHDHLVMDVDVDQAGRSLVTSSYDRTWKRWAFNEFLSIT